MRARGSSGYFDLQPPWVGLGSRRPRARQAAANGGREGGQTRAPGRSLLAFTGFRVAQLWGPASGWVATTTSEFLAVLGRLHWSQRGLADLLGVSQALVNRWAQGGAPVPPGVAAWLAQVDRAVMKRPAPRGQGARWESPRRRPRGTSQTRRGGFSVGFGRICVLICMLPWRSYVTH
jgi:DNA-binding transcriptional regulator YdaS (Cro superfamily)